MSSRSISSRAFEALGRVTWKLARRKATDVVKERTPGAGKPTRSPRTPDATKNQSR